MQLDLCISIHVGFLFQTPFEMSCPSDLIHNTFEFLKWASLTHNYASSALVYFSFFFIELTEKTTSIASSQNTALCLLSEKTLETCNPLVETCNSVSLSLQPFLIILINTQLQNKSEKTTCYHQIIAFLELNTSWHTISSSLAFFFAYRISMNLIQQWVTQPFNSFYLQLNTWDNLQI